MIPNIIRLLTSPFGISTRCTKARAVAPPPSEWSINATGQCTSQDSSEIVVCGRRGGVGYPMDKWARIFEQKPLVAETGIGAGATVRAYVESVEMPNGELSKRMMVGIRLPF